MTGKGRRAVLCASAGAAASALAARGPATTAVKAGPPPASPGGLLSGDALQRRTRADLSVFTAWCSRHQVRGCLGEIGVPDGSGGEPGDADRWAGLLGQILGHLHAHGVSVLVWAADSCLGHDYELALYRPAGPGEALSVANPAGLVTERWPAADPGLFLGLGNHGLANADHRDGFSNTSPGVLGRDYCREQRDSFAYLASRGHRVMRIAFRWERLQPVLGGELASAYLAELAGQVEDAAQFGMRSVLDLHNYGEYVVAPGWQGAARGGPGRLTIGAADGRLTEEHLHDLWLRVSRHFRTHPGILGYGLMNEPHDLAPAAPALQPALRHPAAAQLWERISNSTVNMLRRDGESRLVLVSGYEWSKADRWQHNHPHGPWVDDPARAHVYEAHYYPDAESSQGSRNDGVFGRYTYARAVEDAAMAGYR